MGLTRLGTSSLTSSFTYLPVGDFLEGASLCGRVCFTVQLSLQACTPSKGFFTALFSQLDGMEDIMEQIRRKVQGGSGTFLMHASLLTSRQWVGPTEQPKHG